MEKFNREAAHQSLETLADVKKVLNTTYDLLRDLGLTKTNLKCFVKVDKILSCTMMELFLQLNRHSKDV